MLSMRATWQMVCPAWAFSLGLGGDSESSSTTKNQDQRVVGGDSSVNQSISLDGSNNRLTVTDHGAVSGALSLALRGVEESATLAKETQAATGNILDGALRMVGEQQAGFVNTVETIKTADQKVLVGVGLAVVGLVAVSVFKRGCWCSFSSN